jgi:hypothetical protein
VKGSTSVFKMMTKSVPYVNTAERVSAPTLHWTFDHQDHRPEGLGTCDTHRAQKALLGLPGISPLLRALVRPPPAAPRPDWARSKLRARTSGDRGAIRVADDSPFATSRTAKGTGVRESDNVGLAGVDGASV